MAGNLIGFGSEMLRAFLLVSLVWYGINMMLGTGTALAQPHGLIMQLFFWALIFALFHYYGLIYHYTLVAFEALGSAVMGHNGANAVCSLIKTQNAIMKSIVDLPGQANLGVFAWIHFAAIVKLMVMEFVLGAVWILFVLAELFYLFWSVIGVLLIAIAYAIGPVFLPMLMFRFTRRLAFDGWLGFAWTASMYLFIPNVILGLVAALLLNALGPGGGGAGLVNATTNPISFNWSLLVSLVVVIIVVLFMMWKLPTFINQVSSGAAHAGDVGAATGSVARSFRK